MDSLHVEMAKATPKPALSKPPKRYNKALKKLATLSATLLKKQATLPGTPRKRLKTLPETLRTATEKAKTKL